MRKLVRNRLSKRALTLVELVVTMTLVSIFAAACAMLIYPVMKIYKHVNDLSRAQLLADTVVDSIRSECSGCFISQEGDVWIGNMDGSSVLNEAAPVTGEGHVLVLRKNKNYCETIAVNYEITSALRADILADSDEYDLTNDNGVTSRSIYRLIPTTPTPVPANPPAYTDLSEDIVHFGFFELETDADSYIYPAKRYDFTNPVAVATYREFHVDLTFYDLTLDVNDVPSYCMCRVDILNVNDDVVYSRDVVLCF